MSIFALTTALLTPDFVENFDPEKLASKFVRVEQEFGVKFNKLSSSFVIIGDWKSVRDARNSLMKLISDENQCIQNETVDEEVTNLKINDSNPLPSSHENPGFVKNTGNPRRGRYVAPDKRFPNVPEPVFFLQYQDQTFSSPDSLDINTVLDDYERSNYHKSVKKEDLKKIFQKNKDQMGKPLEKGIPKGAIIPSSKVSDKSSDDVSKSSLGAGKVNDSKQTFTNNPIPGSVMHVPLIEINNTSNILHMSGPTGTALHETSATLQSNISHHYNLLNTLSNTGQCSIEPTSKSRSRCGDEPLSELTMNYDNSSQTKSSTDVETENTHSINEVLTPLTSIHSSGEKGSSVHSSGEKGSSVHNFFEKETLVHNSGEKGSSDNHWDEKGLLGHNSSEKSTLVHSSGEKGLSDNSSGENGSMVHSLDEKRDQVTMDASNNEVLLCSNNVSDNEKTINNISEDVHITVEEKNGLVNGLQDDKLVMEKDSVVENLSTCENLGENKKKVQRKKQKKIITSNKHLKEDKLKSDCLKTKTKRIRKKKDSVSQETTVLNDNLVDDVTNTANDFNKVKNDRTYSEELTAVRIDKTSVGGSKSDTIYKCTECDYQGHRKKRLSEHMGRVHGLLISGKAAPLSSFVCETCNKAFVFQKDLNRHIKIVHHGESYTCPHCLKSYKSQYVYERHLTTHKEGYIQPKFKCQICEKEFTTKFSLSSHVKSEHLGVKKTYCCPVCSKTFSQIRSYRQHANVHAGIRPYTCEICGKSFTYDKSLKEHRYMHDTIRRFQCTVCDKAFRQQTCLLIHMKTHKKKKDHMCSICGREFTQKQSLLRHERIHTGDKPYTCKICGKSFGDQAVIRKHVMMAHKRSKEAWKNEIYTEPKEKSSHYIEGGPGYVPRECPTKKLDNSLTGMLPSDSSDSLVATGNHVTEHSSQTLLNNFQTLYSMPNFRVDMDALSSLKLKQENLIRDGTVNEYSLETNPQIEQFNVANLSDPSAAIADPMFGHMMKKITSVNDEAYAAQFLNLPVGSGTQSIQQASDHDIQYPMSSVNDSAIITSVMSSMMSSNVMSSSVMSSNTTNTTTIWNFPGYSSSLYSPASYNQYQ